MIDETPALFKDTMLTLRELYIQTGAIKPYVPPIVLRMQPDDHIIASLHIQQYYEKGEQEVPLDQVPEFVLEYWERHGRL